MSFFEILESLFNGLSNEVGKKTEFYEKVKSEIEQLKSKNTQELQKIANGWEPEARKRAAKIILEHRK